MGNAFETDVNPIAQTTSAGGLGRIPDELDKCKCIWLKPHMLILLLTIFFK